MRGTEVSEERYKCAGEEGYSQSDTRNEKDGEPGLADPNPGPVGIEPERRVVCAGANGTFQAHAVIVEFFDKHPTGTALFFQHGPEPKGIAKPAGGVAQNFEFPSLRQILRAVWGHFFFLFPRICSRGGSSSSHSRLPKALAAPCSGTRQIVHLLDQPQPYSVEFELS